MLDKLEQIILLKDFYGPLLTERQQEVLNLHYEQDWSLSEIASQYNITRQAVYDLLKRSERSLLEYEERLHLVKRFQDTQAQIEEVYRLLNSPQADRATIQKAVDILRQVSDSI
ncbi:MAG TPA: YlxM family DNA-binding protein [Syntrophomonadaceae bacterium]|nr:YlxM family DNA-binding protein [Syntrophomonadaceae bacterium]HQE23052.1 YlxM family DNA-binding protein [Syntrophomonadaceae bacterium]